MTFFRFFSILTGIVFVSVFLYFFMAIGTAIGTYLQLNIILLFLLQISSGVVGFYSAYVAAAAAAAES